MKNNKIFSIFLLVISLFFMTIEAHSDDLEMSEEVVSGNYYSAGSIYTDDTSGCWVNPDSDVQFIANDIIILKSGFHAHNGSSFKTVIHEIDPKDMDANGLGDSWELLYFSKLENDPNFDSDDDGLLNSEEYFYGTNPQLSSSIPIYKYYDYDPTRELTSVTVPNDSQTNGYQVEYEYDDNGNRDLKSVFTPLP